MRLNRLSLLPAICILLACIWSPLTNAAFFDTGRQLIDACESYRLNPASAAFPNINCFYDAKDYLAKTSGYAEMIQAFGGASSIRENYRKLTPAWLRAHPESTVQCIRESIGRLTGMRALFPNRSSSHSNTLTICFGSSPALTTNRNPYESASDS